MKYEWDFVDSKKIFHKKFKFLISSILYIKIGIKIKNNLFSILLKIINKIKFWRNN